MAQTTKPSHSAWLQQLTLGYTRWDRLCAGTDWPCPMAETGKRKEGHGDEEEDASPRCAVSDDKNPRLPSRPRQPTDYAYSETDGYEGLLLHAISPG